MSVQKILEEFGTGLKEDLQSELIKKGVTSDGQDSRLGASIRFYFTANSNGGPILNLALNDYYEAVNDGRGANEKPPPITPLINWIKRKGLKPEISKKRNLTFKSLKNKTVKKSFKAITREKAILGYAIAISKNIAKHGTIKRFNYTGSHFFDIVVKDGRVEKLKKDLSDFTKIQIEVNINGYNNPSAA